MSRLYSCGWELTSAAANREINSVSGSGISVVTTPVRSGSYALRMNPSGSVPSIIVNLAPTGQTSIGYARVYIYIASMPSVNTGILGFRNTSGTFNSGCRIQLLPTGELQLLKSNGSTVITPNSSVLNTGKWYKLELSCDSSTSPPTATARLDGTTFASGANASATSWGSVGLGEASNSTSVDVYFDDLVVNDNTGSVQNSWPPDSQLVYLRPNAAGDSNSWLNTAAGAGASTNWDLTDESPPDSATTMIQEGATLNALDMYNLSVSGIASDSVINCVQVGAFYRVQNATSPLGEFKLQLEKTANGTHDEGTAILPSSTTWRSNVSTSDPLIYKLTTYVDPDGNPWTQATLDSAQIGVKVTTVQSDTTKRLQVSALWLIADYSPPSTAAKSDSDTGTLTDTSTVGQSGADTGTGTDGSSVTAAVTDSDTAAGTEVSSVIAAIADSDSGAFTDASSSVTISSADTGAFTDSDLSDALGGIGGRYLKYNFDAGSLGGLSTSGTGTSVSSAQSHSGTYSLKQVKTASGTAGYNYKLFGFDFPGKVVITAWVYYVVFPSNDCRVLYVLNNAASQVAGRVKIDGTTHQLILADANAVQLGSKSSALSLNTWHRIDLVLDPTSGPSGLLYGYLDGALFAYGKNQVAGRLVGSVFLGVYDANQVYELHFDDIQINVGSSINSAQTDPDTGAGAESSAIAAQISDSDYAPKPQSLFDGVFPPINSGGSRDISGSGDTTTYILGTGVSPQANGRFTGIRYYVPSTLPDNSEFGIGVFDITSGTSSATLLQHDLVALPVSGEENTWKTYNFSSPVEIEVGHHYMLTIRTKRYAYNTLEFSGTPITNGDLRGYEDNLGGGYPNGAYYANPSGGTFPCPSSSFNATFYGIDTVFLTSVESSEVTQTASISDNDSGTFTEALSLTAALFNNDTSVVTDETESIAETSETAEISDSDNGTFTDSESTTSSITNAETASITDTSSIDATTTDTDTGTSNDTSNVTSTLVSSDTSTLAEASTLAANTANTDTAVGTDASAIVAASESSDAGSINDNSALAASTASTDTAAFTESQTLDLSSNDSGTWTDNSTLNRAEARLVTISVRPAITLSISVNPVSRLTINVSAAKLKVLVDG